MRKNSWKIKKKIFYNVPVSHHFPLFVGSFLKLNFWKSAKVSHNNPTIKKTAPTISWGVHLLSGSSLKALDGALTKITGRLTVNTQNAYKKKLNFTLTIIYPQNALFLNLQRCYMQLIDNQSSCTKCFYWKRFSIFNTLLFILDELPKWTSYNVAPDRSF